MRTETDTSKIFQMLFEMSAGNFDVFIKRTDRNRFVDGVSLLLNTIASEMRASGALDAKDSFLSIHEPLTNYTFSLDLNFTVLHCIPKAAEGFRGKTFASLLETRSFFTWITLTEALLTNPNFHKVIPLSFRFPDGNVRTAICTVSRLLGEGITVSCIMIASATSLLIVPTIEQPLEVNGNPEARLMQQVYNYILENLDAPLPKTAAIARHFGTNTFTLKTEFRRCFNTSIYQFYNEQRLKRAYQLITESNSPLDDIALQCGFSNYPTFSKAFKKFFRQLPTNLKRSC